MATCVEENDGTDAEKWALQDESTGARSMDVRMPEHLAPHYPICKDKTDSFGFMHRLDFQTSGALLCAKSYRGAQWLRMQSFLLRAFLS